MTQIAVSSAVDYSVDQIEKAVDDIFAQLGGVAKFVSPGQKIFLKVNLVRDMAPEKCGTTHPQVVGSVAKRLVEAGAQVTIGDSSGGAYTKAFMSGVYKGTKMDYAANYSGAQLNYNFDSEKVEIDGKLLKTFDVISAFVQADAVINIGKLKTHSYAGYTGCVKNLYGLIPGLVKAEVHSKFPNINEFLNVLIDIEQYASPHIVLHILDGVIGMEGEGPTNGKPRYIGKIFAGVNPYLVDIAGVTMFADPFEMPLLKKALERGVVTKDLASQTDFDFASLRKDFIPDFKKIEVFPVNFLKMPNWLRKLMKAALCPKVTPQRKVCRGCGKCVEHCPAHAITLIDRKAFVNQNKCIRCYCCQELCPFNAIKLTKPVVYRFVRHLSRTKNTPKNKTLDE